MFDHCTSRENHEIYYKDKRHFISDLCNALQHYKKEVIERKYLNPILFYERFAIHEEHWIFRIGIHQDKFKVHLCELDLYKPNLISTIKYCCNGDDEFKNITEFREFLNREVMKEG